MKLSAKLGTLRPHLNERTRRLAAASKAKALGYEGVSRVSRSCGLSRKAIQRGIQELESGVGLEGRIRRAGGGRKPLPSPIPNWSKGWGQFSTRRREAIRNRCCSGLRRATRAIAGVLIRRRHPVSHTKVAQILHEQGYSLQSNRKTEEGEDHPDRDAQFRHISTTAKRYLKQGWPVIYVDT
jgi:hypothetical protein